ncbi:MAG: hypothetical protein IPO27_16210 [Bacteroidetes bacterium]|nr:hypothetical protein [Bacteroidota bacterium]
MRISNLIVFSVIVLTTSFAFAQTKQVQINFVPTLGKDKIQLTEIPQVLRSKDQLQVEVLKYYVANITFRHKGNLVFEEKNSVHLIDAKAVGASTIKVTMLDTIRYDQINFNLGIDSITNVAGALGGDLDPTNGMYWTWQSGYINFKLEGKSLLSVYKNGEFQLHIGGYLKPANALQPVSLDVNCKQVLNVGFDIGTFINAIDIATQHHIMSPSPVAVQLAQAAARSFNVIAE